MHTTALHLHASTASQLYLQSNSMLQHCCSLDGSSCVLQPLIKLVLAAFKALCLAALRGSLLTVAVRLVLSCRHP
jgi:hypothetical protein